VGQQEARRKQEDAQRMIGKQIAQYSGSGVTIEGSPTDVIADTTRETYLDQQAVIWNTNQKSENLRYGAAISDMNAKGYKQAGNFALIKAGIGAAGEGVKLLPKF
jgi:hypothetical protein